MKTSATRFCYGGLVLCLCLVFSSFTSQCQPTFGGITAHDPVNVNGDHVTLDSFSSADPNHSVWQTAMTYHGMPYGVYSDSLSYDSNSLPSRTADFTVASDSSNVFVGNAEIYGFANTAPGGNVGIEVHGSVGDFNWVYGGTTGIEAGHSEDNMTAVFLSKSLPNPASNGWQINWLPVPTAPGGSTNIGGVTYSLLITNLTANSNLVYYSMNELTQSIFIDASNVVLYLTNGMDIAGRGPSLTLNSNSDVQIYSSGSIYTDLSPITNLTEYARALTIYDVAGYTNLVFQFGGNVGPALIYAPSSLVLLASGGTFPYTFIGAIFCNDFSFHGSYHFHYDESLADESFPILPAIIQQPTPQYAQAGSNVTFSVAATGSPPLTYQWYYQLIEFFGPSYAISGATNSSLTIPNPDPFISSYSVVVSNPYGSVASSEASLTVYSSAAATLSGTLNSTNGQFDLSVHNVGNVFGMPYVLQASTNLTDWAPILTNEAPFVYAETNSYPQRYYRAVFVQ